MSTQLSETPSTSRRTICFPFIGDVVGGSHLSALLLARNLDTARFRPVVVLHQVDGPLAKFLKDEKLEFEPAPVSAHLAFAGGRARSLGRLGLIAPSLMRWLRREGVDLVHTNDGRTHVAWGIASRLAGTPHLWHQRSEPTSFGLNWVASRTASHIAAVSRFALGRFAPNVHKLSAHPTCSVVHSPFDTATPALDRALCRARLVTELSFGPDAAVLGYVGSIIPRKRPLDFVRAVAALQAQVPGRQVHGVFLGSHTQGGLDQAVRELAASLGIADHIHLLGFRYPSEPWLAALDLLLVPATDEPFGRTLIEAMLQGTPVIAAAAGGNPEAITSGQTGVLVPPGDPSAMGEAARLLLLDPAAAATLAAHAERQARERYGIDRHVAAISQIYDRLLWSRTAGQPAAEMVAAE